MTKNVRYVKHAKPSTETQSKDAALATPIRTPSAPGAAESITSDSLKAEPSSPASETQTAPIENKSPGDISSGQIIAQTVEGKLKLPNGQEISKDEFIILQAQANRELADRLVRIEQVLAQAPAQAQGGNNTLNAIITAVGNIAGGITSAIARGDGGSDKILVNMALQNLTEDMKLSKMILFRSAGLNYVPTPAHVQVR